MKGLQKANILQGSQVEGLQTLHKAEDSLPPPSHVPIYTCTYAHVCVRARTHTHTHLPLLSSQLAEGMLRDHSDNGNVICYTGPVSRSPLNDFELCGVC